MLKQMRKHKAVHMQAHATSVERMHSHTHTLCAEREERTDTNNCHHSGRRGHSLLSSSPSLNRNE